MKNVKSTKTLMSFSDSSMNLSEMKKVQGGLRCRVENPITGRYEFRNLNVDRCPDLP